MDARLRPALLILFASAALFVCLWLVLPETPAPARAATESAREREDGPPRDLLPGGPDLLARLEGFERQLERLEAQLADLRSARQPLAPALERALHPAPEAGPLAPDARWYLERYVRSFDGGGGGDEFFRLAVAAHAVELLPQILDLVTDRRAEPRLRVRLVELLADARFTAHGKVVGALLELLRGGEGEDIAQAAIATLKEVGDAAAGRAVERVVWLLDPAAIRAAALRLAVALAAPASNAAIARLFAAAPDDAARVLLLGLLERADATHALDVYRLASGAEVEVRIAAAQTIGVFRQPPFRAFVAQWLALETDERVRVLLGAAAEEQATIPAHGPEKLVGPPDADPESDHPNAWASARADMGMQWIELAYDPPLRASRARIFEVCVPGAVVAIDALDESGAAHRVWEGVDPTAAPGVFELGFAPTAFRVARLRVHLDTDRRPGWNEIDAVELVGPDGRAWASAAAASSSYAWR